MSDVRILCTVNISGIEHRHNLEPLEVLGYKYRRSPPCQTVFFSQPNTVDSNNYSVSNLFLRLHYSHLNLGTQFWS
jgi:hypothetical protein